MEPEEHGIMQRPPRSPKVPMLHRRLLATSLLQGFSALGVVLVVLAFSLQLGEGELHARTLAFSSLVLVDICLIFSLRSRTRSIFESIRTPNAATWWVTGGTLLFLTLALTVPVLRAAFRFILPAPHDLLLCVGAALISLFFFEIIKVFVRRTAIR